jgi:hypothetical protein
MVFPPLAINPETEADDGVAIQVKVVPATFDNRLTFEDVAPLHMVCDMLALVTAGNGFTVAICVAEVPVHPLYDGITE